MAVTENNRTAQMRKSSCDTSFVEPPWINANYRSKSWYKNSNDRNISFDECAGPRDTHSKGTSPGRAPGEPRAACRRAPAMSQAGHAKRSIHAARRREPSMQRAKGASES